MNDWAPSSPVSPLFMVVTIQYRHDGFCTSSWQWASQQTGEPSGASKLLQAAKPVSEWRPSPPERKGNPVLTPARPPVLDCQLSCFGWKQEAKANFTFFPWAVPLSSSAIYSSYFCMRLHFRTRKWWAYQRITHSLEIRGKNPNPFVLSCFASSVERETGQGIWSLKIKTTFSSLLAARWEQVTAS